MALYLVTGGAGFIGSHVVEALMARGDHVRVLDNFTTGKCANLAHLSGVEVNEGDIRDAALVRQCGSCVDRASMGSFECAPASMDVGIGQSGTVRGSGHRA